MNTTVADERRSGKLSVAYKIQDTKYGTYRVKFDGARAAFVSGVGQNRPQGGNDERQMRAAAGGGLKKVLETFGGAIAPGRGVREKGEAETVKFTQTGQ